MLSSRLLKELESFAPASLILWCWKIDNRSGNLTKRITRQLGVIQTRLSGWKISNTDDLARKDINAIEKSGEVTFMLIPLAILAILSMTLLFDSGAVRAIYTLVPAAFAVLIGAVIWEIRTNKKAKSRQNSRGIQRTNRQLIDNFNHELYADNLKIVFCILSLLGLFVPLLFYLIPALPYFTLFGIRLIQILQFIAIGLILPFLPYFFDSFTLISAAVIAVVLSVIVVIAIIITSIVIGPCMGCVTLLAFEALLAIEIIADPAVSLFHFLAKNQKISSDIDW